MQTITCSNLSLFLLGNFEDCDSSSLRNAWTAERRAVQVRAEIFLDEFKLF